MSKSGSAKPDSVYIPVLKHDPVLTMADTAQPTHVPVKKSEKIKEKNIKTKKQKKVCQSVS